MTDQPNPDDVRADIYREIPEPRLTRHLRRIRDEVARNRRGEAAVPTWLLALLLVVVLGGWILFIALA